MKTILNILFSMVIGAFLHQTIIAGTLTVTGNLLRDESVTVNDPPLVVKDCNGNVVQTLAGASRTNTKRSPYPNTGQPITFEFRREGMTTFYVNTDMNNISYNTSNGAFSRVINHGSIVPSRYNYTVKVYVDGTYVTEKEYNIPPAGAPFPIGSVIAYMGNSSNIDALRESGWFKCDGTPVNDLDDFLTADERSKLSDIIGNNLPDLRGSFLRGLDDQDINGNYRNWDDNRTTRTGGEGGNGVRSSQGESMRNHTHSGSGTTSTDGEHNHAFRTAYDDADNWSTSTSNVGQHPPGDAYPNSTNGNWIYTDDRGDHSHTFSFTTSNPGNAADGTASYAGNENRPDNIAVYWLIRGR